MKYKGIIRKLDSLGRIVIPREYRKLLKIKETDPLEIIAMESGEIVVRKVDLTAELLTHSETAVSGLWELTGLSVMLSNREKFISGAGIIKNSLIDKPLSNKLQHLLEYRKCYRGDGSEIGLSGFVCVCPVQEEDVFGALYLFSELPISEQNEKALGVISKMVGSTVQRF